MLFMIILHAKVRCNKMKSGVRWTDGNRPGVSQVSQSVSDGTISTVTIYYSICTPSTTSTPSVHLFHLWSDFMRAPQRLPHWTLNPFHAISLTNALISNMFTHFTLSCEHVH